MNTYQVTFIKYQTYTVEAEDEEQAIDKADEICSYDEDAWIDPADEIEVTEL